ncbi:YMGG-like glycine zipper-containing protein [Amphritea pacifica]|uniref:YMGG-like Gly-zipper domain-containing protein n=1 Tax=Amphritea pacifica TaxID=2811233 RepID=A0ABS2W9P0_9GAMM|nr:YMGG-like glycine zipper-containing protein [Amphritea pacifica]MBN0988346.1 hypothetical protein [Amphritea pacifica]MBN1009174.1 hypothetical protein [Amphritea pacifica]
MNIKYFIFMMMLFTVEASANSTLDAAIGGGLGGAVGAAIGNEVGGRDGAIVGGAVGGAVGTAINTDKRSDYQRSETTMRSHFIGTHTLETHPPGNNSYHCPPGQAKKGRC